MCQNHSAHEHTHPAPDAVTDVAATEVAECPVMPGSMTVKADAEDAGLVRDYNGERYWLCCATCGSLFDADPASYAHAS